MTGAKFGAFFYNVINEQGEAFLLYTLSGAPREAFEKFGLPRNTAIFNPTFTGQGVVRSPDITKDPRYGKMAPHHGMPEGHLPVRSYLAVPVISRSGEVMGGLFFGHPEADRFTERAEQLVVGVAAQATVAMDNARLYEAAQREIASRERAEAALRETDQRKDDFLATLAHELRNPLAPIRQATLISMSAGASDEQKRWSHEVITRQVRHMSMLLDDLLDISRITRGTLELRTEMTDLAAVVDAAMETSRPDHRREESLTVSWTCRRADALCRGPDAPGAGAFQSAHERREIHRSSWDDSCSRHSGRPQRRNIRHRQRRRPDARSAVRGVQHVLAGEIDAGSFRRWAGHRACALERSRRASWRNHRSTQRRPRQRK